MFVTRGTFKGYSPRNFIRIPDSAGFRRIPKQINLAWNDSIPRNFVDSKKGGQSGTGMQHGMHILGQPMHPNAGAKIRGGIAVSVAAKETWQLTQRACRI
jgi:hypothetical protein